MIPYAEHEDFFQQGQFIFHRPVSRNVTYFEDRQGKLVTLARLPQQFNIPQDYQEPENVEGYDRLQLIVRNRGYYRSMGGISFALLLYLIKLRWMPDLWMGDDYDNCSYVEGFVDHYDLEGSFKNYSASYNECLETVREIRDEEKKRQIKHYDNPCEVISLDSARERLKLL